MPGALRDAHVAVVKTVGDSLGGPHVTLALITEGGQGGGEGGGEGGGGEGGGEGEGMIPVEENSTVMQMQRTDTRERAGGSGLVGAVQWAMRLRRGWTLVGCTGG